MSGAKGPLSKGTAAEREARGLKPSGDQATPVAIPTCPKVIKGEARREWGRVTKLLAAQGRIAETDRATLAAYCETWANWVKISELHTKSRDDEPLNAFFMVGSRGSLVQHEAAKAQRQYAADLKELSKELGLTVASRLRLPATEGPKPVDPFDELVARREKREAEKRGG